MNPTTRDWAISMGKASLAAFLGAGLVGLAQWVGGTDFGPYTPAVVAVAGVLLNAARKAVQEYLTEPTPNS